MTFRLPTAASSALIVVAASTLTQILAVAIPSHAAATQAANRRNAFFRPPVNVSRSPFTTHVANTSPRSLVLDPSGPAYLLWVETMAHQSGTVHELAMCRFRMGPGWDSTLTQVGNWDAHPSTEPAAAIDGRQGLHVVWLEKADTGRLVMAFRLDAVSGKASAPMLISEQDKNSADPAIAVDPAGGEHVIWSEIIAGRSVLRYRESNGDLWGPVSDVPIGKEASAFGHDMVADAAGALHLTWTQVSGSTNVPMYARRTPERNWEEPESLADERPGWYTGPPVLCAAGDQVWVAWAENDGKEGRIITRARTATGWSKAFYPSHPGVLSEQPAAAADAWGTLHLVWIERTAATSSVVYASCAPGESTFTGARALTAAEGAYDTPMVAADASGRVIATWIDRGRGQGDIMCRHGVAGFTALDSGLGYSR